jgi:hypothetical protein
MFGDQECGFTKIMEDKNLSHRQPLPLTPP